MLLILLRAVFVLVIAGLGVKLARIVGENELANPYLVFIGVMIAAIAAVAGDLLTPRKRIQTISALYFGVIVGIFLSNLINDAIQPAMQLYLHPKVHMAVSSVFMIFICYICVSTLLQTKDDFRFIIPYVEFSKEVKGARPLVLDTSVVIDGRIADVAETRVIDQPMVVPRFVLQELQSIADSSDKLRRNRGRRGLDILNRLQKSPGIEVRIHDGEIPELAGIREVDQRLVILAKHLGGKVVTNDYNLNKIAKLQGVEVINLNDLANAMKPIVLPGETLQVKLHQAGRGARTGRRLPGRRHHGRRRAGLLSPGRDGSTDRHQRSPDQRRADDLRPDRSGRADRQGPEPPGRPRATTRTPPHLRRHASAAQRRE